LFYKYKIKINIIFQQQKMIAGNASMHLPDGTNKVGNKAKCCARIAYASVL
jgi:hypothetical protein